MDNSPKKIPLTAALLPVVFLIEVLYITIVEFKLSAHIPLVLASMVTAIVALDYGYNWKEIQEGIVNGITLALPAILILMVVGTLIGTWIQGGIVPAMIYYGMKTLSPGIFLVATLLICSVVALGTGSSWSTAGTVGVALMGVGRGLGIPDAMVAGAIISGAYFGDKMSPMSDTTNLAPAAAGTDIFSHIRHMVYTTGPSYLIALILYGVLGWQFRGDVMDTSNIETMLSALGENFRIHPIQLLPPLLVIVMVVKKIPPLPALLGGMIIGGVFAMTFQSRSIGEVLQAAHNGFVFSDQVAIEATQVKELLERGGLMSMMDTVALTMCALSFGGIMERTKMLEILALALLKRVRSRGSLVLTTILSCIGMNTITADQYLSIIITGRMYKNAYEGRNLHPKNLSRALEDSATLTSPLIPWNACGAYMGGVLGVGAWVYLPYAFFNLLSPVVSVIYGYTGFTMEKITPDKVSNSQNNRS